MFDTDTMASILSGEYGPEDHALQSSADAKKATASHAKPDPRKKEPR